MTAKIHIIFWLAEYFLLALCLGVFGAAYSPAATASGYKPRPVDEMAILVALGILFVHFVVAVSHHCIAMKLQRGSRSGAALRGVRIHVLFFLFEYALLVACLAACGVAYYPVSTSSGQHHHPIDELGRWSAVGFFLCHVSVQIVHHRFFYRRCTPLPIATAA